MTVFLDTLKRMFGMFRPPRPRQTVPLPSRDQPSWPITLAGGRTPQIAIQRLLEYVPLSASGSVLVVPSVALRPASGAHPQLVAGLLEHLGSRAALGIPSGTPGPLRRRWESLARKNNARPLTLGKSGWDRVELAGDEYMLDVVLLPADLADADHRIFVAAYADEALALGFAREIVHPHSRLRARGTSERNRLDAEVASTVDARYVLDGTRLGGGVATNLCAWTDDPLSAELTGIGVRRFLDTSRGFESVTAWEHQRVQAATELGIGPSGGSEIQLRADATDRSVMEIAAFLGDELGCPVSWMSGEEKR